MKLILEIDEERFTSYENKYGVDKVPLHNTEEAAEYIQAVSKYAQGRGNTEDIIEEMADTLICMLHMLFILDAEDELLEVLQEKLARGRRRDETRSK